MEKTLLQEKFNIVFDTLKEMRLDENILCQEFWRKLVKLKANFNDSDCWKLIVENSEWLFNSGALDVGLFRSWFPEEVLNANNIFTKGMHKVNDGIAIGMGDCIIEATGHSKIILFEKAMCEAHDTTFVKGFQYSRFSVKECMGEAFQNCTAFAKYQSKIEAWDDSIIEAEDYSFVIKHDNAKVIASKRAYLVSQ